MSEIVICLRFPETTQGSRYSKFPDSWGPGSSMTLSAKPPNTKWFPPTKGFFSIYIFHPGVSIKKSLDHCPRQQSSLPLVTVFILPFTKYYSFLEVSSCVQSTLGNLQTRVDWDLLLPLLIGGYLTTGDSVHQLYTI